MAKPGDMLLGRRTWQDFITVWAGQTDGVSDGGSGPDRGQE